MAIRMDVGNFGPTVSSSPRFFLSFKVSISRNFLLLLQTGFSPSLVLLHPHSRFVVVCPFSGALLDSIPIPGFVIGVLPFDEHVRLISVVFFFCFPIFHCFFYFNLFCNYLIPDFILKYIPYACPS
jgi:hypothetical protein